MAASIDRVAKPRLAVRLSLIVRQGATELEGRNLCRPLRGFRKAFFSRLFPRAKALGYCRRPLTGPRIKRSEFPDALTQSRGHGTPPGIQTVDAPLVRVGKNLLDSPPVA